MLSDLRAAPNHTDSRCTTFRSDASRLAARTYRWSRGLVETDRQVRRLTETRRRWLPGRSPMLFAQLRNLVPTPRQPDEPKRYVGRHRVPEPVEEPAPQPEQPEAAGLHA